MALPRPGKCRLAEHIKRAGTTQAEVARRVGVSKPMISKYIAGEKKISYIRAKAIADVLGIDMDDLYEWIPPDKKS